MGTEADRLDALEQIAGGFIPPAATNALLEGDWRPAFRALQAIAREALAPPIFTPWIATDGNGQCPVPVGTLAQVRLRCDEGFDETQPLREACTWRWTRGTILDGSDITHYRTVQS